MVKKSLFCGKNATLFFFFYNPFARVSLLFCKNIKKEEIKKDPKILLCCQASLGDVLLASSVVPSIRAKWPNSKIGFLCTKESSSILKMQKEIDYIHEIPRWMISGKGRIRNLGALFFYNLAIYPKMIFKIREKNYDVSLELHPFFPNSLPLVKKARIPRRIAFDSGGYAIWTTDRIPFPKARYLPYLYEELLKPLDLQSKGFKADLCLSLEKRHLPEKYIVIHVGTSDLRKEWPSFKWKEVALDLEKQGFKLVFTGKGSRDQLLIKEAFSECEGINLCDQVEVDEMALIIKKAMALISVDSFPVHLASLFEIPFVALYLYSESLELWLPENKFCSLLILEGCVRINAKESHQKATYLQNINPYDVLSRFFILKKEFYES